MVGPVSFQGLQTVQISQARYVSAGNGNFRAANEGSFKDKAINWLKETFRPGLVKQENAQAYQAAKDAFIAAGGSKAQARQIFDGKYASGAKFTPADIKPAFAQIFSPEERAALSDEILDRVGGGANSSMTMQASPVDQAQQLDSTFVGDVHRMDIVIDGDQVDRGGGDQNCALRSFSAIAHNKGISTQDITGLSKFANQSIPRFFVNHLQNDSARFTLPDGNNVVPVPNLRDPTFHITSQGGGRYQIDFTGTGPIMAGMTPSGTTVHVDQTRSSCSLKCTLIVGPDASGQMTLLELRNPKINMTMVDPEGTRII